MIRGYVHLTDGSTPRIFELLVSDSKNDAPGGPPGPFGDPRLPDGTVRLRLDTKDGGFLLKDLDRSSYVLVFRAPGCAVVRVSGVLPEPSESATPIDIRLPPNTPQ